MNSQWAFILAVVFLIGGLGGFILKMFFAGKSLIEDEKQIKGKEKKNDMRTEKNKR